MGGIIGAEEGRRLCKWARVWSSLYDLTQIVEERLKATEMVVVDRGDFMAPLRSAFDSEGARQEGTGEKSQGFEYRVI